MAAITIGGLVSGLDTNSIIDALVKAEKAPETQIQQQQSDATSRGTVLSSLVSGLQALTSVAQGLSVPSGVKSVVGSSSNSSSVQVAASSSAALGSHSVTIQQLAQSQVSESQSYASDSAGVAGDGSMNITIGGNPPVTVSWTSADTLDDIAARIGQQSGIGASVLYDGSGYHIIMQGASGAANKFTTSGDMDFGAKPLVDAQDAQFSLDGIQGITRSSNVVSDALPGVTMTLQSVTPDGGSPTTVTVSSDATGLQQKLQSLVSAYNSVSSQLNDQLSYNGVAKGADTLFGDPGAQSLQRQLGSIIGDVYSDGTQNALASDIGLSVDENGVMTLDTTKLAAADPAEVQRLLVGDGSNGMAQAITKLADQFTDPTQGIFTSEQQGLTTQLQTYSDQITQIEDSGAQLQQRLTDQFTAMEDLMQTYQTQQNYLSSVFSSVATTSSKK